MQAFIAFVFVPFVFIAFVFVSFVFILFVFVSFVFVPVTALISVTTLGRKICSFACLLTYFVLLLVDDVS